LIVWLIFGVYGEYPLPYCGANLSLPLPTLSNAKLLSVKVLARHGDRIADILLPEEMEVAWNCDNANSLMGISSPTNLFRFRPNGISGTILGSCSVGQLTDRGIGMHQTLGTNLYNKYVTMLKLLTDDEICSNAPDSIFIRSTYVSRTIQSAQTNMYNFKMKCPGELLDISISYAVDEFLTPTLNFVCPAISEYNFFDSYEAQLSYKQFSSLVTQAQEIFQNPSISAEDLITLHDPLIVRYCHIDTYPFPSNIPESFMIELNQFFNAIITLSYNWNSSLVASPMMNTILGDWMNYVMNPDINPLGPKYSLLLAHDSTIGYALGLMMGILTYHEDPPYASHMEFELWEQDNSTLIMISLNGEYIPLPTCGNNVACDFTQFYQSLPLLTNEQWQILCHT